MKRRFSLEIAACAAGAALLAGGAAAQQKTYELKVAVFAPKPSTTTRWFEEAKADLAKKSDGRLKMEMFYGSSMGPMPRHYELARKGVADMAFFQHGVTPGRFPLTELTHAPYLFPPGAKGAVVAAKAVADVMDEHLRPEHKGTRALWVVFNRPSGVYDSRKPIRSLADLEGRRYRAPTPTDVVMMKALGALPIGMPATHMAESLQKGTIDGVVTDPMGIFAFKLGGLVKHYTPMFVSVISFGLAMNAKSYDRLPGDLKALVDGLATKESAVRMGTYSWGQDPPPFTAYMKGLELDRVALSKEADAEMRALAKKVVDERIAGLEKKGLPARKVHDRLTALSARYAAE